jgi:hypothetical protein
VSSRRPSACANRFGADALAGAGRPGEVEREPLPRRIALAEPPLAEDQVVLPHLRQRLVEGAARGLGEDDVVERQARNDRLRERTGAGEALEDTKDRIGGHDQPYQAAFAATT